jgi:tetratricopeptide (TPR) repeat protein
MTMTRTLQTSLVIAAAVAACGAGRAEAQSPAPPSPLKMAALRGLSPMPGLHVDDRADDRADDLYSEGREAIESGRYDRAVERFDKLIELKSSRTDAALYWKAYSLAKLAQRDEALKTLTDLQKRFADSRWIKEARALEVEVRQASCRAIRSRRSRSSRRC